MTTYGVRVRSVQLIVLAAFLAGMTAPFASDLGRLFTTPEERLQVDAMRRGETASRDVQGNDKSAGPTEHLTLNGTLRGSDGRQRVWINGQGFSPTGAKAPATLLYDGRVRLQWQNRGTSATLKPGQTLDKVTGDVYEAYEVPIAEAAPVTEE